MPDSKPVMGNETGEPPPEAQTKQRPPNAMRVDLHSDAGHDNSENMLLRDKVRELEAENRRLEAENSRLKERLGQVD